MYTVEDVTVLSTVYCTVCCTIKNSYTFLIGAFYIKLNLPYCIFKIYILQATFKKLVLFIMTSVQHEIDGFLANANLNRLKRMYIVLYMIHVHLIQ